MKQHIPNALTLGNLFCGCIAVVCVFSGHLEMVAMFTFLSLLLDVADGLIARMLKVNSSLGIQLDSLADMVSFGLLPGAVMYALLNQTGRARPYAQYGVTKVLGAVRWFCYYAVLRTSSRKVQFGYPSA